jgi:hypothetical protein
MRRLSSHRNAQDIRAPYSNPTLTLSNAKAKRTNTKRQIQLHAKAKSQSITSGLFGVPSADSAMGRETGITRLFMALTVTKKQNTVHGLAGQLCAPLLAV